jgi:DNA replication and repair protein RecF
VFVTELKLNNFRNIVSKTINLNSKVILFIGKNGQGKTNILEAIYYLLNGKSFRNAKIEHLVNKNNTLSFIQAFIMENGISDTIKAEFANGRRKLLLNGKSVSPNKIISRYPCVLFSPESLSAIKEGPEFRRQLVDELLISSHPKNILLLNEFNKILKVRNKALKDYLREKINKTMLLDVLLSLDQNFIPLATKVTVARIQVLKNIKNELTFVTSQLLNKKNVDITVDYLISGESARDWSEKQVYYALLKRHEELFESEKDSGMSLIGPQRHDIQFLFDQVDARYYCSQGQQRTLILAFKMAQIMYHHKVNNGYPLLLLDDVLSELDPDKRNYLIEFLRRLEAQIILTTTDLDFNLGFETDKLTILNVDQGEVSKNV